MALIKCSHCGETISDSANFCPHCGYDFNKEKLQREEAKEYSRLTELEQNQLKSEYNGVNPDLAKQEKAVLKTRKIFTLLRILTMSGTTGWGLIMVLVRLVKLKSVVLSVLGVACVLLALASLVACYVYLFKLKKQERFWLAELKRFQIWLKENKQITYNVILTEKQKKIFNSIQGGA